MKATDAAWLAGLFDGEGCIWNRLPQRANVVTEIKMTCKKTVERVNELFPGRIAKGHLSKGSWSKLSQWRWTLDTNGTLEFAKLIAPYVVTKKTEVERAIAICSAKSKAERISIALDCLP